MVSLVVKINLLVVLEDLKINLIVKKEVFIITKKCFTLPAPITCSGAAPRALSES